MYYRENTFDVASTVVAVGCMYPLHRYPTPSHAEPLRLIRNVGITVTIAQREKISLSHDHSIIVRTTLSLAIEISLIKSGTDLSLRVRQARATKKEGRYLARYVVRPPAVTEVYKKMLLDAVKARMGPLEERMSWDGWDLLRLAATMPGTLRTDRKGPSWRAILPLSTAYVPGEITY